jgi:putative transposase
MHPAAPHTCTQRPAHMHPAGPGFSPGIRFAQRRGMGKPRRLAQESYRGLVCVFITCATHQRHDAFADSALCTRTLDLLHRECTGQVEVTSYCLMPDHAHLLLTGLTDGAELLTVINRWKQFTGYEYRTTCARRLWQGNYLDWILRDGDDALATARYIVSDPVRSGLVSDLLDYRWWGSHRWSRQELVVGIGDARAPRWWSEWR